MPRRTNDFQKLVSLIQKALAPEGAKVTDSAMVQAPGIQGFREIDILIVGEFGPYQMKVAVEAKALGRPLDLIGFESIIGKYFGKSGIPVSKVAVVTPNGFTADVVREAELHGVLLLTLKEAKEHNWAKHGPMQMRFSHAPHICGIAFDQPIKATSPLPANAHLVCPHGHDVGTLGQYINHFVSCHLLPQRPTLLKELYERARKEPNGQAVANITMPLDNYIVRLEGREDRVKTLSFRIHVVDALGTAHCTAYELTSAEGNKDIVQHIKATLGGHRLEVVLPKGMQSPQIVLNIQSDTPATAEGKPNRKKKRKR